MAVRFTSSLTSFKSGRLSEKLFNRIDTKQYKDGASVLKGMRVMPEGGATKTTGTRLLNDYLPSVETSTAPPYREIPFNFNGNVGAILLFRPNIFETGFYIVSYPWKWDPLIGGHYTLLNTGTDPRDWDYAITDNNIVLTHTSGKYPPKVIRFDESPFGYVFQDVVEFYDIPGAIWAFPLSDIENKYTINLSNVNTGARTIDLTCTDPDGVALLQDSLVFFLEGIGRRDFGDGVNTSYVASNFYLWNSNIAGGVRVFYYLASGDVGGSLTESLTYGSVSSTNVLRTSMWNVDNWPRTVTSHESRLVFGGTPRKPMTIFGSKVTNPFYMNNVRISATNTPNIGVPEPSGDIVPSDPYVFTISSTECSAIHNIRSSSRLFVGTDRKEYIVHGGDTGISPLSIDAGPRTAKGSYPLTAVNMDDAVAYISNTKRNLYMFKYNAENGSYQSVELSLLFSDLLEDDTIEELEWAAHVKVLYIRTGNKNVYGITYEPQADTVAFFDTCLTDIVSMSYISARPESTPDSTPDADEDVFSYHLGDHLLMMKQRGSRTYNMVSYENTFHELGVDESGVKQARSGRNSYAFLNNAFRIDRLNANEYNQNGKIFLGLVEDKFPVTDFTGLTVPFYAYNVDTEELVEITSLVDSPAESAQGINYIDHPDINGASKIIVGKLPDPAILATLPIEAGMQFGTAQMGIKSIDELGIRHYKSYSYEISNDGQNWQEVRVADNVGEITSGRKNTKFSSNQKHDQIVWIRSNKPEPLTIVGINMRGVSNDG